MALTRLEEMLANDGNTARPPIHLWDPPARPDIGLAIQRNGAWTYEGSPIERTALVKLFASVLRREDDGHYFVVTPIEKVPVRVVDAPFMAVEMEIRGSGTMQDLIWRTNVDDVVVTGAEHVLRFALEGPHGGLKPYVLIRNDLEARVTRALYYDLVDLGTELSIEGVAHFGVWSGGQFFAMAEAATLDDTAGQGSAI